MSSHATDLAVYAKSSLLTSKGRGEEMRKGEGRRREEESSGKGEGEMGEGGRSRVPPPLILL